MSFERGENFQEQEVEIREMWAGGPTRVWAAERGNRAKMPYGDGGFVGTYICQGCQASVVGVYYVFSRRLRKKIWVCAECKQPRQGNSRESKTEAD